MKSLRLTILLILLFSINGCRNAAGEFDSRNLKITKDANNNASSSTKIAESEFDKTGKFTRQNITNDRRVFLRKALEAKMFLPTDEVLLSFSQVCELTLPNEYLDVIGVETLNPDEPELKIRYQTLIFSKDKKIINKLLMVAPLYCDENKLFTIPNPNNNSSGSVLIFNKDGKVTKSESSESERATVYADLKVKPVPVYKKKQQEKGIDERQPEYQIDDEKISKMKLNDRKRFLAETIKNGFSQLYGIAFVKFSQICELETGSNVFYVIDLTYSLHNASSDRGQEKVFLFDKKGKIVNEFYTDLAPKFCDGDKLFLFSSSGNPTDDGQQITFDDEGKNSELLDVKSIKLKGLPIYKNLKYKPVELQ